MLTLPNVATSDQYTPACTLGPIATAQQIVFVVANAAVLAQIAPLNQESGTLGDFEQDEILLTPQSNVLQRAGGIRFRSAVAGVPAQIVAQLITPADPVPGAGTPFTAKLAASGGVSPGTAAVQIQKNGALIGTEPILDFIDGVAVWSMADDAANTRVTVKPGSGELGYVETSANTSIPNGSWGDVLSLPPITYDGATLVLIEFFAALVEPAQVAGGFVLGQILDNISGSAGQVYLAAAGPSGGGNAGYQGQYVPFRWTPPAGTHTTKFQVFGNGAGVIGSLASGYQATSLRVSRI